MEIPVEIPLHPSPTIQQREVVWLTELPVRGVPGSLKVSARVRGMGSMSQFFNFTDCPLHSPTSPLTLLCLSGILGDSSGSRPNVSESNQYWSQLSLRRLLGTLEGASWSVRNLGLSSP